MNLASAIQSLSLVSGLFVVGIVSAVVSFPAAWIKIPWLRLGLLYGFPLLFSIALYWSPVWFVGPQSSDYFAWALACIIPWTIAGATVSGFIEDFVQRRRN